jgi:GNAT superfamily N-acetyltransferase
VANPRKRAGPRLRLVPLTPSERSDFIEQQIVEYAEEKSRAGIWSVDESLARSRAETLGLVGEGPDASGHEFFRGRAEDGTPVGWIWLGPVPGSKPEAAVRWLYQITIEEVHRGKGYGRALLRAAERYVRETGGRELRLNVFRWNRIALALYDSSGYRIAEQSGESLEMRKQFR